MRKGNHIHTWRLLIALVLLASTSLALAKSPELEPLDSEGKRSWIIEFSDPPLVRFDGRNAIESRANQLEGTAPREGGGRLLSWRTYAERYPGWFLLGALVVGFGASAGIRTGWSRVVGMQMLRRLGIKSVDLGWAELERIWTEAMQPDQKPSADGDQDGRS